jgi:hypothetical protein
MKHVYYAKPTSTDGQPGIWAHFSDDQNPDCDYCIHVYIADLINDETKEHDLILEYANGPSEEWLRDMILEAIPDDILIPIELLKQLVPNIH